ncbi:DUF4179 domain-containing protein [Brevibacillus sp. 179-C 1.1 NHS]|uniref:DUF4179 domain-containing protein n=1 Tax=Brevibacillus sp. 179-C 1.1 NHS TaxID=3235177 RepID=UPI0039A2BC83
MSCQKTKQLVAYLENTLSDQESEEMEAHLENCLHCLASLDSIVEGISSTYTMAEEELRKEPIADKIIEKLPDYPLGILKLRTIEEAPPQIGWKERGIDIMKKTALAVASIAAVVAMGTAVSPSFATYVTGLYANTTKNVSPTASQSILSSIKELDQGVLKAASNGFAQPLKLSATDQGLTVEMKEVLADPLRIVIAGVIKDKDGNSVGIQNWRGNVQVKNKKGEVLKPFHESKVGGEKTPERSKWYGDNYGGYLVLQRELSSFFNDENPLPDDIVVEFRINEFFNPSTEKSIKGKWNFDIPINVKQTKAATKTLEVNQQYTSPQGTAFTVKEMSFAPSGTRIVTETNIKGGWDRDMFSFQILDEKGNVAANWEDVRSVQRDENDVITFGKNVIRLASSIQYNTEDKTTFLPVFAPLDPNENYTLALEEINKLEKANFKTQKLVLDSLKEKPVTVKQDGHTFTFGEAKMEKNVLGNEHIVIDIEGTLGKDIVFVEGWSAVDEHGVMRSAYFDGKQSTDDAGNVVVDGKLFMDTTQYKMENGEGVEVPRTKEIKELTIDFASQRKAQPNVNWEVPLQAKN